MEKQNNSRKITDIFPQVWWRFSWVNLKPYLLRFSYFYLFLSFAALVLLVSFLYLYNNSLVAGRAEAQRKLIYWKKVASKFSNYQKAYYMVALYEASLGEKDEALKNLKKARELDPDFKEADGLERELLKL